jgi:hypothetical protein
MESEAALAAAGRILARASSRIAARKKTPPGLGPGGARWIELDRRSPVEPDQPLSLPLWYPSSVFFMLSFMRPSGLIAMAFS